MRKSLMLLVVGVVCLCPCYTFGDGNPDLQYMLAEGYLRSQDYVTAVKWFRIAAENGHPKAKYQLGRCYEKGLGVARNIAEAKYWYREAEKQGDSEATAALRRLE